MFTSLIFRIKFGLPYDSDPGHSLTEDDVLTLKDNLLDDVLVEFVERMKISQVVVKCETIQNARREVAENAIKNMLSKLHEKRYLQLTFLN